MGAGRHFGGVEGPVVGQEATFGGERAFWGAGRHFGG